MGCRNSRCHTGSGHLGSLTGQTRPERRTSVRLISGRMQGPTASKAPRSPPLAAWICCRDNPNRLPADVLQWRRACRRARRNRNSRSRAARSCTRQARRWQGGGRRMPPIFASSRPSPFGRSASFFIGPDNTAPSRVRQPEHSRLIGSSYRNPHSSCILTTI